MIKRYAIRNKAHEVGLTEEQLIANALDQCEHDQSKVAQLLGVSQAAVSVAMKRLGFRLVKRYITQGDCL